MKIRGLILVPLVVSLLLSGCVTLPDGTRQVSETGKAGIRLAARATVRHYMENSPRAEQKVQNIRIIVAKLQLVTRPDATLSSLTEVVKAELVRLNLSDLELQDANDFMDFFAIALEEQLGPDALDMNGVTSVNQVLTDILSALPPPQ